MWRPRLVTWAGITKDSERSKWPICVSLSHSKRAVHGRRIDKNNNEAMLRVMLMCPSEDRH